MKKAFIFWVVLAGIGLSLLLGLAGCGYTAQPGETEAEGHRRHLRNMSVNQQLLMEDVDNAILLKEPSKASSTRTP